MSIAKSNQDIVENTHSKPQETLEFKMTKQKESFSFDVPLELPEQWMTGVTSLEVYNSVCIITSKNDSFEIRLTEEQIEKNGIDTKLVFHVEVYHINKEPIFFKIVYGLMNTSFKNKKKLKLKIKRDFNYIKKLISQYESEDLFNKFQNFETIDIPLGYRYQEIMLQSGICELTDLNTATQLKIQFYNTT